MKITKYIHSCLLLEKDTDKILFDPGKFSFAEGKVKPKFLKRENIEFLWMNKAGDFLEL